MISVWWTIGLLLMFLISSYTAFCFGMKVGKSLKEEVPAPPLVEGVRNIVESVAKGKKEDIEPTSPWE